MVLTNSYFQKGHDTSSMKQLFSSYMGTQNKGCISYALHEVEFKTNNVQGFKRLHYDFQEYIT